MDANSTSFAPPGESSRDLWVEKSFLDGFALAGVGYGIVFSLTWQTLYSLLSQVPRDKIRWGLVGYIGMVFALATIGYGSAAKINEESFIQDRNAPGGPTGFEFASFASPVNMMGVVAYVLLSWIADGLVLWRFWFIWGSNYLYTAFPALMLLGSVISSLALIITSFKLEDSFWAARSVQFGTAYWSLSVSLNILLTLLISGRILWLRRRIPSSLGPGARDAAHYFSAVTMLIESAALYALVGLIFLITYARASTVQNLVFPILGQVEAIAPLLILARVVDGRAWTRGAGLVSSNLALRNEGIPLDSMPGPSTTLGRRIVEPAAGHGHGHGTQTDHSISQSVKTNEGFAGAV